MLGADVATETGSQASLFGVLFIDNNGTIVSYPTAKYTIDDSPGGTQNPWYDSSTDSVVYFFTPKLADGTHEIDVTVTTANETNPYVIDFFLVTPNAGGGSPSGVVTSRNVPTPGSGPTSSTVPIVSSTATPVGPIVGGVVGGIAGIALLIFGLWYFLRRRSGGQAYYFEKPTPGDILAGEAHVEPFNATPATTPAPSSAGFTGRGPQSAYSDGSAQPLNPSLGQATGQSGPSETGLTYVSGSSVTQPRTGKAALIAQQFRDVEEAVQLEDSGIRFNENGQQAAGPSQLPSEVPPTYTPN